MNHSKFNFYDAFCFDDNILMFAFLVSMIMVAEEELNHQGRRTESRDSVLGHNIINHYRKRDELRLYNNYFAENPKFIER
jgi:hypothetical protein